MALNSIKLSFFKEELFEELWTSFHPTLHTVLFYQGLLLENVFLLKFLCWVLSSSDECDKAVFSLTLDFIAPNFHAILALDLDFYSPKEKMYMGHILILLIIWSKNGWIKKDSNVLPWAKIQKHYISNTIKDHFSFCYALFPMFKNTNLDTNKKSRFMAQFCACLFKARFHGIQWGLLAGNYI